MTMNEPDETPDEAAFSKAIGTLGFLHQHVELADGNNWVGLDGHFTIGQLRGLVAAIDKVLAQG